MKQNILQYNLICKILLVLLCSGWIIGCVQKDGKEYVKKPANLLSKEKMISFLIDLHLTEAKMSYIGVQKSDSVEMLFRNYEHYLFEKHDIDDSVYYQSYQYYLSHMNQLDEIYSAVVDSLSVLNSLEKSNEVSTETP